MVTKAGNEKTSAARATSVAPKTSSSKTSKAPATKPTLKALPVKSAAAKLQSLKDNVAKRVVTPAKQAVAKQAPASEVFSRNANSSGPAKGTSNGFRHGQMASNPFGAKMPVTTPKIKLVSSGKPASYKVADNVVYPGHGVGEITEVQSKSIGGSTLQFYGITIAETGMKILVPCCQAEAVGLRKVVDKKTIDEVYDILRDRAFKVDTQTWNRRFREYSQKIKTGSLFEIAQVLRDLSVLGVGKELSFGEKKMLEAAENLLVSEIAIAKARPADRVKIELREMFAVL